MKKILLGALIFLPFCLYSQCYKMVATGGFHTLALETNGTLWAWGYNEYGQLGTGTTISVNAPVQIGSDSDWKYIEASTICSYAIKENGTLWAWGAGLYGSVGNGSNSNVLAPVQIGTDTQWKIVEAGSDHIVALKNNGTLWSWGYNLFGQLGDGTNTNKNAPVQIGTANDWESVSAGFRHTLAIKTNGTLWSWGENNFGALGDGSTINRNVPAQVGLATDWQQVSAGNTVTEAIKENGTLWAWGHNFAGCFGSNSTGDSGSPIPIQIGLATNWQLVSCGLGPQTLAIKTDGTLWTWGFNNNGQLGIGSLENSDTPIEIGSNLIWKHSTSGIYHSGAINLDGGIIIFGDNGYGAIGNSTYVDTLSPFEVPCMTPLKVSQPDQMQFGFYPNPVKDILHLEHLEGIGIITIADITGKTIMKTEAVETIDLSGFQAGVYLLNVSSGGTTRIYKVVKL
ncbi:MAG TPA: T9SS type A sorting domain-containing protein [Flavobacterium sp.]|nr:T9SS type A sorting domain-containing protein [Flavobacterium sp.]